MAHPSQFSHTRALLRDRASQFTGDFDEIFRTEGFKILRTPARVQWPTRSPNAGSRPCAQGIRNPQAHPADDITEQEALEQPAALSVLARWVDACEVDRAE